MTEMPANTDELGISNYTAEQFNSTFLLYAQLPPIFEPAQDIAKHLYYAKIVI